MSKLLEWKEPPSRYATRWQEIAEQLKAHPGRWALVAEDYGNNTCKPLKKLGIETKSHRRTTQTPHRYDIYARFDGDQ